jgi:hypothetical protein
MLNKTLYLLLFISKLSLAAQLKIITGYSDSHCSQSDDYLFEKARKNAMNIAGENFEKIGPWVELAYNSTMYGSCRGKKAHATSLFQSRSNHDTRNYLIVDGGFNNPRLNINIPAIGEFSDEVAYNSAIEHASQYALKFCSKIYLNSILSKEKIIFDTGTWYDYYKVRVELECITY